MASASDVRAAVAEHTTPGVAPTVPETGRHRGWPV